MTAHRHLLLAAFAGFLTAWTCTPQAAAGPCAIPETLALRDLRLPAAKDAIARDKALTILTLGGAHTAGEGASGRDATYPVRLEAELTAALPRVRISVANEAVPHQTAPDMIPRLPALLAKTGARLVIWAPGGRDVALRLNVAEFGDAIAAGIAAIRSHGADAILIDTTFVPSPTRVALIGPYRERLRGVAATGFVPLLPRHDMMALWAKDGTLNLAAREPAEQIQVARALFACVAHGLAVPIAAALR